MTMTDDDLGDRMKAYERRETGRLAMPSLPLYARIDGRCFSAFTRGMARPFDATFAEAMDALAVALVEETNAVCGYTQSDEINLAFYAARRETQLPFGGRLFKLTSCLAAAASARFTLLALAHWPERARKTPPTFDCRVFELPTRTELANCFLWRERDATKNAVSMAARAYYGPADLDHRSAPEMQEMLFEKGINFNDYPARFKRGVFIQRRRVLRDLTDEEKARIPPRYWPNGPVERSAVVKLDMPPFGRVANREAVIFEGAEPETASP